MDGETVSRLVVPDGTTTGLAEINRPTVQPSNRRWNLWMDVAHRGSWNMAADYTLLAAAQRGEAWLRLYRWDPACLSFGRNEPALTRYDRDRIEKLGLEVVRRPTGGRAVWHEDEVTYAIAAPLDAFGSMAMTYRAIHEMLSRALERMGLAVSLAERPVRGPSPLGAGSCFASPAGGEILSGSRKLAGSAQVREANAFLQHGSILLRDSQQVVAGVTRGAAPAPVATSLSAESGRTVSFGETSAAIAKEAATCWAGSWTTSAREPDTNLIARFADPAWIWRR